MARHARTESRFAWPTVFYLLLVLIAPMVLLGTPVKAQEKDAITGPGAFLMCLSPFEISRR